MGKIISSILSVVFVCLVALGCGQNKVKKNLKVKVINAQQFKQDSKNKTIVDVRTEEEFGRGHLKNAINIDFFDENYLDYFAKFNKKEPIYLYCRSGRRSNDVANELKKIGFEEVYDLKGGLIEWKQNNFELEN